MATATVIATGMPQVFIEDERLNDISASMLTEAQQWASKLRADLANLLSDYPVTEACFDVPRRKHKEARSAELAALIAPLLFPAPTHSLSPLIRYEETVVQLRARIIWQRKNAIENATEARGKETWNRRILDQGPWNQDHDPVSLDGPPAVPMPVTVSDAESLNAFFEHLKMDRGLEQPDGTLSKEPYYGIEMMEFEKGVLYADQRLDLCKKVVGPTHISSLMSSLETNTHVKHFLLGNNIIGPSGAIHIANFISNHPDIIETWYLAGNCLDAPSFKILVDSLIHSPVVTNLWLKRNPLASSSAPALFKLITQSANLRTLDLDQTALGDKGVAELFTALAAHEPSTPLPLRHLYLNANGISTSGCTALATYLSSSHCKLESLYLGANPLGNKGSISLAAGLARNTSLLRLFLPSTGLSNAGCSAVVSSLKHHPKLSVLDLGQSFATQDLGQRYNYLTDEVVEDIIALLLNSKSIRLLHLGTQPLSYAALSTLNSAVAQSTTLLHYFAKSTFPRPKGVNGTTKAQSDSFVKDAQETLVRNMRNYYLDKEGKEMSYGDFVQGPLRFWRSSNDVRKIDSVYRNRDAGLARRGLMRLEKEWGEGEEGLEAVLAGE